MTARFVLVKVEADVRQHRVAPQSPDSPECDRRRFFRGRTQPEVKAKADSARIRVKAAVRFGTLAAA